MTLAGNLIARHTLSLAAAAAQSQALSLTLRGDLLLSVISDIAAAARLATVGALALGISPAVAQSIAVTVRAALTAAVTAAFSAVDTDTLRDFIISIVEALQAKHTASLSLAALSARCSLSYTAIPEVIQ